MIKKITTEEEWAFFKKLLIDSFPVSEYRNPERIKIISQLEGSIFVPNIIYTDNEGCTDNRKTGIVTYWDFRKKGKNFIYVEHLASSPDARNQGFGAHTLAALKVICPNIIGEVEMPDTEMALRRINFYKRNGGKTSDIPYLQAPYTPEQVSLPLLILYFGQEPTVADVLLMKHTCYPISYVRDLILPRYEKYDAAHKRDHIEEVIDKSFEIKGMLESQEIPEMKNIDSDILYFCAAYHDLGIDEGRELHHINSAKRLSEDPMVHSWFTASEIEIMKEAIEDHRSSKGSLPRNIYGKILAEADRTIVPETILQRTLLYGKDHYPELNKEEQYHRFKKHLLEKYSENGYLKLIFSGTDNAHRLCELRSIIADEKKLRSYFEALYTSFE